MNLPVVQESAVNAIISTRQIAEATDKRHDHVLRDTKKMLLSLNLNPPNFGEIYLDGKNREQVMYVLDYDLAMTLVTGYDVALRHKVVTMLNQLLKDKENEFKPMIPQTLSEALRLAADQQELIEKQSQWIEKSEPKVEVFEQIANSEGLINTTELAKQLGTSAQKLNKLLREKKIKYQDKDLPTQYYLDKGWFKVLNFTKNEHSGTRCMITGLGVAKISRLWGKSQGEVR